MLLNIFSNFSLDFAFHAFITISQQKQGETNKERKRRAADCLEIQKQAARRFSKTFLSNQFAFPVSLPRFYFVITRLCQSKIPSPPYHFYLSRALRRRFPCEKAIFACFDKSCKGIRREEKGTAGCVRKKKKSGRPLYSSRVYKFTDIRELCFYPSRYAVSVNCSLSFSSQGQQPRGCTNPRFRIAQSCTPFS